MNFNTSSHTQVWTIRDWLLRNTMFKTMSLSLTSYNIPLTSFNWLQKERPGLSLNSLWFYHLNSHIQITAPPLPSHMLSPPQRSTSFWSIVISTNTMGDNYTLEMIQHLDVKKVIILRNRWLLTFLRTHFYKLKLKQMNTCSSFCFLFWAILWLKKRHFTTMENTSFFH